MMLTMVDQADLPLARLTSQRPSIMFVRDLSKESLSVRPGDRKAGDLRNVLAFCTGSVLVCGIARSGRIARVKRQELDGATLHGGRIPGWASRVCLVTILDRNTAVVPRVRVDQHAGSSEFLGSFNLGMVSNVAYASELCSVTFRPLKIAP